MTMRGVYLVAISALLTAAANLLLRGGVLRFGEFSLAPDRIGQGFVGLGTQPMFMTGVVLYGLAAIVWFSAISIEDLSTSYPILVGLVFILVALGAIFFYQEAFSWQKLVGMAFIVGGIAIVAHG